jgi:predicted PurR-regulated permease PerM
MITKFYRYLLRNQVILALFIIAAGWFLFHIRGIIVSIFISYIIMAALLPGVKYLRKKKFPKILAVLIPYLGVFLFIFLLIIPLIPFVLSQVSSLINSLPQYLDSSATIFGFKIDQNQIHEYLSNEVGSLGKNAFSVTSRIFGGLLATLTVLVVSFYLLNYDDSFKRKFAQLFDEEERDHVHDTLRLIDDKLGAWLRGQAMLCFAIGLGTFLILTALNMPYALPLALIAGFLEVLPTLGPILSAVPAIMVALTISPAMAVIVAVAYLIIQTLENNLLVPKIMQHAVGLNPVIVILSIMIGANLMGITGALLAIPFVSFAIVVVKSLRETH